MNMKKKMFSMILMLSILINLFSAFPAYAAEYTWGQYTYTVSNSKATITKGDASISGNLVIPSSIGGYPVVAIKYGAFKNNENITSVTIPNSVTSIGNKDS